MHGAAHNSFGACVRRLQRGARRGFATGSSSAASAETCPRGLRAHRGSCQSEVRSVIVSISLSILGADKSRKRTNTHHPHVFVTCIIRCRVSHTCTPALTKVGHIRRSAVPPAHRRARLGAHDTRPAGAGGLRPPQRAHELRDGHRPHRPHEPVEQRDRRGRSPRRLLLAAHQARRHALLLQVEEEPCAHGHGPSRPHATQVHLGWR